MSGGNAPQFGISKNLKMIDGTDIAGGGQVVVENGYAYVVHMDLPHGTSILDVKHPKLLFGDWRTNFASAPFSFSFRQRF
jgi:hypothetical protein